MPRRTRLGASGRLQLLQLLPRPYPKAHGPSSTRTNTGNLSQPSWTRPGTRLKGETSRSRPSALSTPEVGVAIGLLCLPRKDQHSPLQSHRGEHGSKITALLFQRAGEGRRCPEQNPGWLVGHEPKTRSPVPAASVVRVNSGWLGPGASSSHSPVSHHPAV